MATASWTMPRSLIDRLGGSTAQLEKSVERGGEAAIILLDSKLKTLYLSGDPVHRRSGNLSRSLHYEKIGRFTWRESTGLEAPYARFVNDGTKPHTIFADAGRTLRFEIDGEVIYRREVHHPGTQPTHFMERALAEQRQPMIDQVTKRVLSALRNEPIP